LPDFITFNPRDDSGNWTENWWTIETEDLELRDKEYDIQLQVKVFDYKNHVDNTAYVNEQILMVNQTVIFTVDWNLKMTYFVVIPPNFPPTHAEPLPTSILLFIGYD